MADTSLPNRARRALDTSQHSQEQPFTGKSVPITPNTVIRLRGANDAVPSIVNGKVPPPPRIPNKDRRSRE